jgi:hypothetical protein
VLKTEPPPIVVELLGLPGQSSALPLAQVTLASTKRRTMTQSPPADITKRLLFILHRGLVQMRNLATASGEQQISDLTDSLEIIPGLLDHWEDGRMQLLREILRNHQGKYPSAELYNYLAQLEEEVSLDHF